MKQRSYIWLFTLLAVMGISCKRFLDTKPTDFLQQATYYQNEDQLTSALASVYDPLGTYPNALYSFSLPAVLTVTSDDVFFRNGTTADQAVAINSHDYTSPFLAGFWEQCYKGIERANVLIANINNAQNTPEEVKNAVLGEAKFLRGYYHFLLVQYFGDVPLKITPTTDPSNVNIPRTATRDVYAQILKDMTEAEGLVYSGYTQFGNSSSRVTKTAVEGILARVCLFMAGYPLHDESKYADALDWANKAIASGIHALNTAYESNPKNVRGGAGDELMYNQTNNNPGYVNNPYSQVFLYEAKSQYFVQENMWEVDFNATNDAWEGGCVGSQFGGPDCTSNYAVLGRSGNYVATHQSLYLSYGKGDFRRDWNCAPYSYSTAAVPVRSFTFVSSVGATSNGSIMGRPLAKWRREYEPVASGNTDKQAWFTSIKFPLLRYADVLLMKAEAENQVNGPTAAVYDIVNQVRRRAYGIVNGTAPIKAITITSQGTGYTSAPAVGFSGSGFAAATTGVGSGGNMNYVGIQNAGIGYSAPPIITFTGGGGSGAAATAVLYSNADVDLPVGLGKTAMQDSIAMERYREFPGECLRRNDLIRWGRYLSSFQSLVNYYATTGITNNGLFTRANLMLSNTLGGGNKYLLFPIPASEILVNKAMTQNPGW